ncbi:glycosyltransferase family 2 protein [Actinoplanes sp. NPDC026619]|uniref:glycosyltransferase family 2 protein n=1 Tax=Actinoplanes sp. NPDC026619 TaxID=3155798 RepID=UPI0033D42EEB
MLVLLPVYRPGPEFLRLLRDLRGDGTTVVVVDDGSGPSFDPVLASAESLGAKVLHCFVNRGKGAALKTGFRHCAEQHPDEDVVTADGDGQHTAADVRAVAALSGRGHLVLGVRRFDRMPLRSRVGNVLIQRLFRAVTGQSVSDTQTGLRAYPASLLKDLGDVPGERFEYEMNVLLAVAGAGCRIDEVPIPATYLDGNAASHFGGVTDSVRVLGSLMRHAAGQFTT